MKYTVFQRAVHKTDPRSVVLFASPYSEMMPFIVAQAEGLAVQVDVFRLKKGADPGASTASPRLREVSSNLTFSTSGQHDKADKRDTTSAGSGTASGGLGGMDFGSGSPSAVGSPRTVLSGTAMPPPTGDGDASDVPIPFEASYREALEQGRWLVVPNITDVTFSQWRELGKILFALVPEDGRAARRHFRILTFLEDGVPISSVLPPLITQYASAIDTVGVVRARTSLAPIFDGTTTLQGFTFDESKPYQASPAHGRRRSERESIVAATTHGIAHQPYSSVDAVLARIDDGGAASAKTKATDPQYMNEIVFTLRTALIEEQALMLREAEREDEAEAAAATRLRDAKVAAARRRGDDDAALLASMSLGESGATDRPPEEGSGDDKLSAVQRAEEDRDWVFHKILAWAVNQCPDADLSSVQPIPMDALVPVDVLWATEREQCHSALWQSAAVLLKKPQISLRASVQEKLRKQLAYEAARHYPVRHPHVLTVFGVVGEGDGIVLEAADATLDQVLLEVRSDAAWWSLADMLTLASHVLKALGHISSTLIHRDVSLRSVVRTAPGVYKLGQFGCSLPVIHPQTLARSGLIPMRTTAPEGFDGHFAPSSDMWSFGVMMWQLLTYGQRLPYKDVPLPDGIIDGPVLPRPAACPEFFYDAVIEPCLRKKAGDRPTAHTMLPAVLKLQREVPAVVLNQCVVPPADGDVSFDAFNSALLKGRTVQQLLTEIAGVAVEAHSAPATAQNTPGPLPEVTPVEE